MVHLRSKMKNVFVRFLPSEEGRVEGQREGRRWRFIIFRVNANPQT